jgi:hypothetical protein
MNKNLLSIIIIVLFGLVILQRCNTGEKDIPTLKIDTVLVPIPVHDTVQAKPKLIKSKADTLWRDSVRTITDSASYKTILENYYSLGDKYYEKNTYQTEFKIKDYGSAIVTDTVFNNKLIGTSLIADLLIPEKTITIEKPIPAKNQLYVGGGIMGNPSSIISGINTGLLFKDKKDKIIGVSVIYNGNIQYGINSYWKIKF